MASRSNIARMCNSAVRVAVPKWLGLALNFRDRIAILTEIHGRDPLATSTVKRISSNGI